MIVSEITSIEIRGADQTKLCARICSESDDYFELVIDGHCFAFERDDASSLIDELKAFFSD